MTGVPRHIAEHRLNIREGCLPIRQKKRGQAPKRNQANLRRSRKTGGHRYHERSPLSQLAIKPDDGKEARRYHALQRPEINYTPMEKLILALVEEHDIHYRPRTSIKGKILADFIVERPEDDPPDTPMEDKEELPDP
ncbi:hypothetical protein Tco_0347952 [Tanacetum coccineum]